MAETAADRLLRALCRYYGDLIISALQDHAFAAYTLAEDHMQFPRDYASLTGVPPPMLKDNWDFDSECLTGEPPSCAL